MPKEKRLGLVVGCSKYLHANSLKNPLNDANAMASILRLLEFKVLEIRDPNFYDLELKLIEFSKLLQSYDVGLFFFAGHGVQFKGNNYLVPIEACVSSEEHIEESCLRLGQVLSLMEASGVRTSIIILDACRNNPFERGLTKGTISKGLAAVDSFPGSLIAYSTSPGKTASDGLGRNGLYTHVLIAEIAKPNQLISQMFQNIRKKVARKSNGTQIPWESTSLFYDFYFVSKEEEHTPYYKNSNEAAGYQLTQKASQILGETVDTIPPTNTAKVEHQIELYDIWSSNLKEAELAAAKWGGLAPSILIHRIREGKQKLSEIKKSIRNLI